MLKLNQMSGKTLHYCFSEKMEIFMKKKSFLLVIFCIFTLFLFTSCKKEENEIIYSNDKPNIEISKENPNLDFTEMHNFVIDSITSQETPFFYIEEGKFDISGDNDKKVIKITCTCMEGTTVNDLDLFLSLVLNYIGANAAEQDFRFKNPSMDSEGSYTDFGTVFSMYDLQIDSKDTKGNVIRNDYIKAGDIIPIESRIWSE